MKVDQLISEIKKLPISEQIELINRLEISYKIKPKLTIPISIFKDVKLSALELVVRYLHEIQKLKFSEISKLLNRKSNTIWTTYKNAIKKSKKPLNVEEGCITIPVEILSIRKFSVLESIVSYLKDHYNLSFKTISELLGRNYQTIRTVYLRYKKKK